MALKVNERNLVSAQIGMHIQASNRFPEKQQKHEPQPSKTCIHRGIGAYASYPMHTHPKVDQGFFTDLQKMKKMNQTTKEKHVMVQKQHIKTLKQHEKT